MKKSVEDLNGFEMLELKKTLGTSLENADNMDLMWALAYVFKKRENAEYKHDDALGMSIREIQEYLGVSDEDEEEDDEVVAPFEDPKA